ncbi:hypothetical protein ACG5V6_25370 [Streptomyces chitinivorans]|uniref:Uncharacterized protein n=1 Tax=Streptomyces chitinivorans TaxID=1257027 RepID=A0ABW7I044_9ACTN|nr:hypothetical protein [Streptomyces chitinivorans]MDH2412392.1 hypothetical protein [Streptomyces chitinivorans]
MTRSEQLRDAARLWREHLDADFPADLRGVEFEGIDMVMLDADTAGCVCTWLNNGGALDPERRHIPQACLEDLARVIPQISAPSGRQYHQRLHRLALLVLSASKAK